MDFSEAERQRTREVMRLLEEPATLDPLGIGRIRDAFADLLFPGTSTIQTRARYFLIVAWLFRDLERRSPRSNPVEEADSIERQLITRFRETDKTGEGDLDGLIGRVSGTAIRQLPSAIYWQGLNRWRIRRRAGSLSSFLRELRRPVRPVALVDDGEMLIGSASWWDPELPEQPDDLWKRPRLNLTTDEAGYLSTAIAVSQAGTLLAHLALRDEQVPNSTLPWELPPSVLAGLNAGTDDALDQARLFSLLMRGASILYALMLAELKADSDLTDRYRELLSGWRDDLLAPDSGINEWCSSATAREEFWRIVQTSNPGVPSAGERQFVGAWMDLVREIPDTLQESKEARDLLIRRETLLKGPRAKLANASAREYWQGAGNVPPLDYRWGYVKTHLRDIHTGLALPEPD